MAIADEASVGLGFPLDPTDAPAHRFAAAYYQLHMSPWASRSASRRSLPLMHTTCLLVPETIATVQPKARTPQVGCTTRSLSHHLALLPPVGQVETTWRILSAPVDPKGSGRGERSRPLNLLVVPFPYSLPTTTFRPHRHDIHDERGESWGSFDVDQVWLRRGHHPSISTVIDALLASARREVDQVDGVVLPELALDTSRARQLARSLHKRHGIDLFVAGALDPAPNGGLPANVVWASLRSASSTRQGFRAWCQAKHHRWQVNRSQVTQYSLGASLRHDLLWWERIRLERREVHFHVFRGNWSLAALVCEDLARIDPVQQVLRAIGPNLVIVLLMDGPQLEWRWPARYATGLADDPGSSVLTVTCLGMVRRWRSEASRTIAMWKDETGRAQELTLGMGDHALLLTVSAETKEGRAAETTLDRRPDLETAVRLVLTGCRGVALPRRLAASV